MITPFSDDEALFDAITAGAAGYVLNELHLAEKTVKNYVSSLLAKLGMERRTQAAAYVATIQPRTAAVKRSPLPAASAVPSAT